MNPYLLILLGYALLLVLLGLYTARHVRHSHDFFVADRRLNAGLLFSTLLAANIGAGSTVGATRLGYELGLSAWWWVGSAGLGSLVLAFWVGPRVWKLAKRYHFLTVGDFLEYRYSRSVRGAVALILNLSTLFILAGQLMAVAWILQVVAGTSKATGCLLGGAVAVLYFTAGGLKGSAWINALQLSVKLSGFVLAVPLALGALGGWEALQERILAGALHDRQYFQMTGIGARGILAYLVMLAPSFFVSPGLLQKVYGARDEGAVRLGAGANALVLMLYSFCPVLLGMCAAAAFPSLENPDLALPTLLTELLPLWLGAALLAAVFSAEVSSADAVLFMLSTSLSKDLYRAFINPSISDRELLRLGRRLSVGCGILGVGLALWLPSVIAALSVFYALLAVALTGPLLVGLYRNRPGARTCLRVLLLSLLLTLLVHLLTQGQGWGIFSPTSLGIALSILLLLLSRR